MKASTSCLLFYPPYNELYKLLKAVGRAKIITASHDD